MRPILLALISAICLLGLSACQIIYKLPTRQGNVLDQRDLDQLATGMTREQVKFLLGTPIATNPFRADRWDYVGYYKSPRGTLSTRTVTLYFEQEKVARIEGVVKQGGDEAVSGPDVDTVLEQERKDQSDAERDAQDTDTGVIITPQN